MPPSSTRRTRTRKLPENVDRSDGDDADSIATPSRKRKRTARADVGATSPATEPITDPVKPRTNGRSRKRRGGDAQDIAGEVSFEEEDVDSVIRNLRQSKEHVQARVDFANEVHEMNHPEGKQAYAKIAGNGWTFYVEDVRVRIGRPPDDVPHTDTVTDQGAAENADALVHIDLGPSKLVSRQHAEIRYDEKEGRWYLHVGGRNGLKLDERPIKRGEGEYLNSGSVIDIAETQMMFVTPNEVPLVHPTILAQITASGFNNEDDEDEFGMDPAPDHMRRTPGRLGTNPDPQHRPASKNGGSGPVNGGGKSHMQAGTGSQHDDGGSQANIKTSPSYARGMMLETMEGVDYSIDSAKDLKPPHSYATLIGMAILSSPEEKLTLSKIYDWIKERYAFYRLAGGGWQNSIRHNLSLNKCFEKVARRTDEPGKGMKWQIVPEYREDFIKKGLQNRNRNGRSSAPTSPFKSSTTADNRDPFVDDGRPSSSKTNAAFAKTSPGPVPGSTPPLSRSALKQTFTPDRGTSMFSRIVGPEASSPQNGYYQGSPFPLSTRNSKRLNGLTEAAAMAGTPGGPALLMNSDPNDAFATPFITKYAPRLAPPSAAQLPSQFMPMSSPAPFWKYAELANSTPARQTFGSSPIKREPGERGDGLHLGGKQAIENDDGRRRAMSSSPPPIAPDRSQGSPARGPGHSSDKAKFDQQASQVRGKSASSFNARQTMTPPVTAASTTGDGAEDDDDDDEEGAGMIDLAKGFQPIGSFHRHMSAGVIRGN